jgi:hypothetical protein
VHLIKRGTLPKTSSGKVRRREAKARLESGTLDFLNELEASVDSVPPPPSAPPPAPAQLRPSLDPRAEQGRAAAS